MTPQAFSSLDVEAVVSGVRAGGHGAGTRQKSENRYEVTPVQSEPGEVPTMIASEPTDIFLCLVERYCLGRRVTL